MVSTFTPPAATVRTPPGGRGIAPLPADSGELDPAPLVLPAPWTRPPRHPLPVLASVIPVVGAVVLWLVTGSMLSLWFALLGPLVGAATLLDGVRDARRARTNAEKAADGARAGVADAIAARHSAERRRQWAQHPDVALFVSHDDDVWRAVPGRADMLVVGSGAARSDVRVEGGQDDAVSRALRARAATLQDAPVLVPASAGIAVVGPSVLVDAVVRALALQRCLTVPPGELQVLPGPAGGGSAWMQQLPHAHTPGRSTLAVLGPDDAVPREVDIVLVRAGEGGPTPPRCEAILTISSPQSARLDYAGHVVPVAVEAVSEAQALAIAGRLADRAGAVLGQRDAEPSTVLLAPLLTQEPSGAREGLAAVIGVESGYPFTIDLAADGPHAVVAGVTGSGKSELLITWILSLCATHTTQEVSFLLADFKGGTAFDALAAVPHVTGVITDLDGAGARRAIESLRAEVRWREAELARVGARDVRDARADLPRLVIVVDEFAALLDGHPELHAVFTDVAARGRALGMHLILGTQRVVGVVRDALLANCPLRLSLRVTDPLDSRAVVGTDQAAQLPGGAAGCGIAFIRRAGDRTPTRVRVALTTPGDVAAAMAEAGPRPRRPWLPELPPLVRLDDLRDSHPGNGMVLGLVDEPERQQQRTAALSIADRGLLVVGGGGSGRTTILRAIAAQAPADAVWVSPAPEQAWDVLAALTERPAPRGTLVLIDDLDALAARFPHDYAAVVMERIEHLLRATGDAGIFVAVTMQRPTGLAARFAELLPHRAVLALPSRAEYIAAGGEPAHYAPDAPAGRGRLDGRAIQFCVAADGAAQYADAPGPDAWFPAPGITGFVGRRSAATRDVLAAWQSRGARIVPVEDAARETTAQGATEEVVVIAGDPDQWQRHWALLAHVRGDHDLVIDAACQAEYRLIAGERDLPPYCAPSRGRAWLRRADGQPARIALPGTDLTSALDRV